MSAGSNSPSPATEGPSAGPRLSAAEEKPRFALFIATAAGLGYIPVAPGTFGSLVGVLLALLPFWGVIGLLRIVFLFAHVRGPKFSWVHLAADPVDALLCAQCALAMLVAAIGAWSSTRVARFWSQKDPQRVVIDEVSGQHLAIVLGCGVPVARTIMATNYNWQLRMVGFGLVTARTALNWKYLLLGLILFRVFDIWKPFPARQAESLPGGWGIMADDWVAAIYAALGLWLARALGL